MENKIRTSSKLTKEHIEEVLKDIMFKGNPETGNKPLFKEFNKNLDEQIQSGYMYMISSQGMTLMTGTGGIRDFIKANREQGLPDWMIAQDIYVSEDRALMSNTKWYWIGGITWKKINEEEEKDLN